MNATLIAAEQPAASEETGQSGRDSSRSATVCGRSTLGSPYIPVDSWVYPAALRLYSMGYIDHVYLGMRPWTRASLSNMLEDIDTQIQDANSYGVSTADEAQDIYADLIYFLHYDAGMQCLTHQGNAHVESVYTVARGISGTPLRDSYHLGSTVINDYGRPYENGINNYSGASGYAAAQSGPEPVVLLAEGDLVVEEVRGNEGLDESPIGGGRDRSHRNRVLVGGG